MNDELEPNTTASDNNAIHEAVEFYWGERCSEHEEGCATCAAWSLYDKLTQPNKDSNQLQWQKLQTEHWKMIARDMMRKLQELT